MGLHQQRPGYPLALFVHQDFELHRQPDIGRAQLHDIFVQRMQQRDRLRQRLVAGDDAEMPPQLHAQRQPQLVLDNDADHAERGTSQRVRILRAGRLFVDRPEADQRVDLVGERDRDADRIGRHQIVRALRLVVILDGVGDRLVLALRLGVVAAHEALQLGEFADHFGEQIGLAQQRGALGLGAVGADHIAQLARQRVDARDALGLRAELLVEHDAFEFRQPVFQPCLQVGVVEELGVGKPRADHALVAGDDRLAAVARFLVGHQNELVHELGGLRIAQHEAFLVVADGRADHLAGDRQERGVERAHQRHRPFDQSGDLGQAAPRPPPVRSLARRPDSWRRRRIVSARRAGSSITLAFCKLAT